MSIPFSLDPLSTLNNEPKYFTLTAIEDNSSVKISKIGTPVTTELYFKTKNNDWTLYTIDDILSLNKGDWIQFWNHKPYLSTSNDDLAYFTMTGKIKASGNIQSLLNFNVDAPKYCFRKLFQNCTSLIKAPKVLPASIVEELAYGAMFSKTSITNFPKILATTLGNKSCQYMFEQCPFISIDKISFNTVGLNSCFCMFSNCNSLIEVKEITATNFIDSYNFNCMFEFCKNLLYPPAILPLTSLTISCYQQMFQGCEKMLYAPILPAQILKRSCYQEMFKNCKELRRIEVNFTDWLTQDSNRERGCPNWISGARNQSDVNFICPEGLDTTQIDNNHVLSNWNIIRK